MESYLLGPGEIGLMCEELTSTSSMGECSVFESGPSQSTNSNHHTTTIVNLLPISVQAFSRKPQKFLSFNWSTPHFQWELKDVLRLRVKNVYIYYELHIAAPSWSKIHKIVVEASRCLLKDLMMIFTGFIWYF